MAYQMKSSPAKLGAALRAGRYLVKYGKKIFTKSPKKTIKSTDDIETEKINKLYEKFKKNIRKEGTKTWKNSGNEIPTEKLPLEERWSARYFSLDKVLKPVIIEESNKKEVDWFYSIASWDNYINFFASEEAKTIKRPYE